jgi:hypothetical protein
MRHTSSRLLPLLILLPLLWLAPPARADVALAARLVELPGVKLQDVQLRLAEDGEGGIRLDLHAGKADVAALGWKKVGLGMQGVLRRGERQRWQFDGKAQLAGAPGGAFGDATVGLVVDESDNTLQASLQQGTAQASAAVPLDQTSHAQISLKGLPAGWLQGLLAATLGQGRVGSGKLDAEMALDVLDSGIQTSGEFALNGVGFDAGSSLAGQGLSGSGRLGLDTTGGAAQVDLDATLRGGELLLGPVYARLPGHAVQLSVSASARGGAYDVGRLHLGDADALQLDGALALDARNNLQKLRIDRFQARFPAAYQRYGQALVASALGLRNLHVGGQLEGSLDLEPDGPHSFAFNTDGLDLADADGRLAIGGLHGGLDWARQGDRPATSLGWRSLQLYRLAGGTAQARLQSRDGTLRLGRPLEMPLLGGRLRLGELAWRPAAGQGQRLDTALAVTGVDMAAFSRAMGWPQFPGTLAGAIPSLRWADDRLELGGGLSVNVFGGFVDVTRLSLQQPFGNSPVLSADVDLRQLDLAAMTSVFDFGSISGRMDGQVEGLRLVDWNPVAFKAQLQAPGGGRISQRAVNNLSSLGGSGSGAGLQGVMLRLFKSFGYRRIGLSCTLQAEVCRMGGLDGGKDGYTIVEGSGLPHLQVVGHQTEVDWPTLVRRLKAATEGTATPQVR